VLVGQLDGGKTIADLAKTVGVLPGTDAATGRVEIQRNSVFGPMVEAIAFSTPAGTRAQPFRCADGIVILKVETLEKGAQPELDKVIASALMVPYAPEPDAVQKAQQAVSMGQVELVVRDDATLRMLPQMFRPQSAPPAAIPQPRLDGKSSQAALEQLQAEMQKLQGSADPADQARLKDLEARYQQLKMSLRTAVGGDAQLEQPKEAPKKL
jgi:hypothetical protein